MENQNINSENFIVKNKKLYLLSNNEKFNKENKVFFHKLKGRYYQKNNQWIFPEDSIDQIKNCFNNLSHENNLVPENNLKVEQSLPLKEEGNIEETTTNQNTKNLDDVSETLSFVSHNTETNISVDSSNNTQKTGSSLLENLSISSQQDLRSDAKSDSFDESSINKSLVSSNSRQEDNHSISNLTMKEVSDEDNDLMQKFKPSIVPIWNQKFSVNPPDIFYEEFKEYYNYIKNVPNLDN